MLITHLVHRMSQLTKLVHTRPGLHKGVVSRPDGAHAGRLIPCVALSAILKVRVRPARAVHADVASGGYMGAAVWLGHDGHHCNP